MTGMRLDKWLWFARFARTRSSAARLCAEGLVTLGGAPVSKPGHLVRVGDVVTVHQGRILRCVRVLGLGDRRRSAAEAAQLYAEADPPVSLREVAPSSWTPLIE
jgi:ribosome-associated heat shock protein Hsp15